MERVELDEGVLDRDAPCKNRGCQRPATWSGQGECAHPIRACNPCHDRLVTGTMRGVRCRCGAGLLAHTLTWVKI